MEYLSSEDVISVESDLKFLEFGKTVRVDEVIECIAGKLRRHEEDINDQFVRLGLDCQVLKSRSIDGWRKGKIKITIEFIPASSEGTKPLDQFRQQSIVEPPPVCASDSEIHPLPNGSAGQEYTQPQHW